MQLGRGPTRPRVRHIAVGIVTDNIDLPMEGKVLVRVPALDQECGPGSRAPAPGTAPVLLRAPRRRRGAASRSPGGDPNDAFVIGGLWNEPDRIPVDDPVTALTTRILRSGVTAGTGHEIEMDDLLQSVTITTSTGQKITMDPTRIELTNMAGTVKINLDNTTQSMTIKAAASISLEAPQITIKGATVEINGSATTTVKSAGVCQRDRLARQDQLSRTESRPMPPAARVLDPTGHPGIITGPGVRDRAHRRACRRRCRATCTPARCRRRRGRIRRARSSRAARPC